MKFKKEVNETMFHLCVFNFKLLSFVIIQIKNAVPLYPARAPLSLFTYLLLLVTVTDDNRMAQIIRIIRMFYILSTNSVGVSIAELVSQFGVCERTIYRDLDRLEYAGIPLIRENHYIKLMESNAADSFAKKVKKVMADGELKIRTKPGKMYDVARALIPFLDSIHSIEPRHLDKWIYAEANRHRKDTKP